jgi:hypothetical protein
MQSIKAAFAAGAIVAAGVGGAYAAGVVNESGDQPTGHETAQAAQAAPSTHAAAQPTQDQTAHGHAVAAVARAGHAESARPAADETTSAAPSATADPTESPSIDPSETATAEPTASPSRDCDRGRHAGWSKKGRHHGRGHGPGAPASPGHTKGARQARAAHQHGPHQDAKH